ASCQAAATARLSLGGAGPRAPIARIRSNGRSPTRRRPRSPQGAPAPISPLRCRGLAAVVRLRQIMDRADYRRASYAVWERMAPGWDDRHAYFEKVAWPVSERMLERLGLQPGQTVLELAAGTGALGFAAAGAVAPAGRVVVSDFSQQMVEAARRHAAELGIVNVECRVLDAEGIALPDDAVDCVLCRWGYMLMADPVQALAETHRVLRAGGRLSCAVFA